MKRAFALALGLLFLGSTGLGLAEEAKNSTIVHAASHPKKKKRKKVALNPQPLPPRVAPPESSKTNNPNNPTAR